MSNNFGASKENSDASQDVFPPCHIVIALTYKLGLIRLRAYGLILSLGLEYVGVWIRPSLSGTKKAYDYVRDVKLIEEGFPRDNAKDHGHSERGWLQGKLLVV